MNEISSQELANLLNRKTKIFAIKWAKKQRISYSRKKPRGPYWFNKKEVGAKLDEMNKVVTAREAADILGICLRTLYEWVGRGYIKPIGKGLRNTLIFKKSKIVRFKHLGTGVWLPWQKTLLIIYYNEKGLFCDEIAKKLGKSPSAVRSKASRMGLGKNNQREFYFLKDVADFFETNRYRVEEWVRSKKLEAVSLISSGGRIRYRISLEQIAEFMIRHPRNWKDLKPMINFPKLPGYSKLTPPKN